MKIRNLVDLFTILPENERIIVDVLRQIIIETLPKYCSEKISYNVPFFYGNKGICIIWPSTVPRGGIKKGVLLGFWYGNKLKDVDRFLDRGTNKQIFYKIYQAPEQIDEKPIIKLLKEAIVLDGTWKKVKKIMENTSNAISSFDSPKESAVHYDEFYGPMFFEPYAIEVARRIDPSSVSVALEIASGTGRVTRHIRKRISASAKLIASDIDEDMLTVAKEKLSDLEIDWQKIDAQEIPFSDNSIDLVVCCFGYMFVPDKPKAIAEAYRVLKPGGMFLFTTWDKLEKNGASYIFLSAAKKHFEGVFPDNLATSMNDESIIRPLLKHAGFSEISIEKVQKESVCSTAKEAALGLVYGGPVIAEIKKRNPASIDELIVTVEKELSEKFGAAPMIAPISAVISQAWK